MVRESFKSSKNDIIKVLKNRGNSMKNMTSMDSKFVTNLSAESISMKIRLNSIQNRT